jgi:C1A family cysteine protease
VSKKLPYIFNLRISSSDSRDFVYKQENETIREIVDISEFDSPVEDQENLGSCVAHAVTSAYENLIKQKYPEQYTELSKLYHYYHTRYIENTVTGDMGVIELRNAIKALHKYCICAEYCWPYNKYNYQLQPSPLAYSDAVQRTIVGYASLKSNQEILSALNDNSPVVVGFEVFSGFDKIDSSNPIVSMPGAMDYSLGGHSVCLVGYSIPENKFLAKNSFGQDWGNKGYFWIPFDYASTYFFDNWVFQINNQKIIYEA